MGENPDQLGYVREDLRGETVWWLANKSGATRNRDEAALYTRRAFSKIGPYDNVTFVPALRAKP